MAKAHVKFNNRYKQERTVTVVLVTVARKAVLIQTLRFHYKTDIIGQPLNAALLQQFCCE